MPRKSGYTVSDEIGLRDEEITWPDGARCCLLVTVNLSVAAGPEGITAAALGSSVGQFALGDGLEGLLRVLRRRRVRATFAVPAAIAAVRRDAVRALPEDGHEVAAHGLRHEDVSGLDREEERARMRRATEIVAEAAGRRPEGWFSLPRQGDPFAGGTISPHTMALLRAEGYAYLGNGLADDAPHWWVTDPAAPGGDAVLMLPYYYHFDDQFFCMFPAKGTGLENPDFLLRNWRLELEAQYARGRCFSMVLHPQHMGLAHRLEMLDRFLGALEDFPGLWNPTGAECARHWSARFPAETHLRLRPSVWRDYPGSLS
jgi:peptidoglycan/xylan/chitin deacetylase (PgdA/CDA1 family)